MSDTKRISSAGSNDLVSLWNNVFCATYPKSYPIEVSEGELDFQIVAEVPGVQDDDVLVEVAGGILRIAVNNNDRDPEEIHKRFNFEKTYQLPDGVNEKKISAVLKHGLLKIIVPKAEKKKPKRISVSVDS